MHIWAEQGNAIERPRSIFQSLASRREQACKSEVRERTSSIGVESDQWPKFRVAVQHVLEADVCRLVPWNRLHEGLSAQLAGPAQ